MTPSLVGRVRDLALALPGTTEKLSHGAPAFFARRQFAHLWPEGHHDQAFPHLWLAAPDGVQARLVETDARFFVPPYVGGRGWVGLRLDGEVDWDEVADLLADAHGVAS